MNSLVVDSAANTVKKPRPTRFAAGLGILLFLSSCAAGSLKDKEPERADIAPDVSFKLPRPSDLGRPVRASQLVTARHDGQTFVLESHLRGSREQFLLIGLDTMGRRAMTIRWNDTGITVDSAPWLPDALRPHNLLLDIVLTYWPEKIVRASIKGSGVTLEASGKQRRLFADGREIVRIDYLPSQQLALSGQVSYRNFAWGYELDIHSTEVAP